MLNFSVSQDKSSLLLEDRSLHPLYAPREESLFIGRPSPSPPRFSAWQVEANISAYDLDLLYPPGYDSYGRALGTSMGGFAFAYEHVLFPARDPSDILLLFNLIGITDGYVIPDIEFEFSAANRTEETIQIVLNRDPATNNLNITALELVPRGNSTGPDYLFGEQFGRRLSLLTSESNVTTFIPREWDECGRKDDAWRQRLCELSGWWYSDWSLFYVIFGSIVGSIPVLASLFYLVWLLRKGQTMSAEYLENLEKSEDEFERLIATNDLQNDVQGYSHNRTQGLLEADMVVMVDGEPKLGGVDVRESPISKPLPQITLETGATYERQMPNDDGSVSCGIEEDSHREENQFGPFMHNLGNPE